MDTKTLHIGCTTCPNDCALSVTVEETSEGLRVIDVCGNRCPRGIAFARQEITRPVRVLATTVCITGGDEALLPVRSAEAIPRDLHMQAMDILRSTVTEAPVEMGDVIVRNILDTGVDIVASMDVNAQ